MGFKFDLSSLEFNRGPVCWQLTKESELVDGMVVVASDGGERKQRRSFDPTARAAASAGR